MSQLDWPASFDRTSPRDRGPNRRFDTSLRDSIDDLADELQLVGVDDWRLETDAEHQTRNPNYPYADANPDDPSAIVRWSMDGEQYAAACDAYSRLRDNVRTLYLYVREKRKMENRPVVTGESEFANARLPPAEGDPVTGDEPPHVVLGVAPDAPDSAVKSAARALLGEHHPDNGDDPEKFQRVKDARDSMLGGGDA